MSSQKAIRAWRCVLLLLPALVIGWALTAGGHCQPDGFASKAVPSATHALHHEDPTETPGHDSYCGRQGSDVVSAATVAAPDPVRTATVTTIDLRLDRPFDVGSAANLPQARLLALLCVSRI